MRADVQAVVVRWRGGDEVEACLQSLLEHGGPRLGGITLVDSGSGDGGADRLAESFPSVQVIALADNLGFAHAADTGGAAGNQPLMMLLNPDTRLEAGALDRLAALLDARPRAAGAVPLLHGASGASQHRWQLRRLPTALRLATGRGGTAAFVREPAAVSAVEQPAAAAWLIRRRVWDALGGLDPVFAPAWWEDVDFCGRLRDRRLEPAVAAEEGFLVEPRARVAHAGGSSVAALGDAAFLTAYHRNLLRYAARHHAPVLGLIRAGVQASLAVRALLRPARAGAYRTALRTLRER